MKKFFGIVALVVILTVSGCGANTLTCKTKDGKEEIKMTFKNDKVTKVVSKSTYETKEEAQAYAALGSMLGSDSGMKIEAKGKDVVITMTGKAIEDYKGTKAELKKQAEEEGYTCK